MKRYKSIDFYLQVISLLMIVATTVINKPGIANPVIYIFLFACLQIVSILLHFFTGLQTWKKSIWKIPSYWYGYRITFNCSGTYPGFYRQIL